jgi:tetratricopeptide (TPR) repeat protein
MLGLGPEADLVADLSALVAENPLRERLSALLMIALYRTGRQADALAVYADTRRRLVDDVGVEPGPQLQRLHREILGHADVRATAGSGANPVEPVIPRQLPPAVRHFAGRLPELATLQRLAEEASAARTVVVAAIDGTAGIGKTALAVHWAHRVAPRFPDGQLYVNLRGFDPSGPPVTVADAVRGFLDALEVAPDRIPTGLPAQTALYRSLLAGRRMLVLLDNARDAGQVRPLLPGSSGCLVLVTSRERLIELVATEGAHPVTLGLLSDAEAEEILACRLGAPRLAEDPAAARELIVRCARLPLALAIVAARAAAHPDFPMTALAREIRESEGLDAFAPGDPAADVRSVFSWSYRTLSQPAASVFRLLGLHPGPDIAAAAAASLAGVPVAVARRALAELARAHLVTEHAPGRYAYHDLLRAYAGELVHAEDGAVERTAAMRRLLDHYLHTGRAGALALEPYRYLITPGAPAPGVSPVELTDRGSALAWFTAEHANLLALITTAAGSGFDTHAWQLAWTMYDFLEFRGHWGDLAASHETALEAAQRLGDRRGQSYAQGAIGQARLRQGRPAEATAHFRRAAELAARTGDRVAQAHARHGLAMVASWERDYRGALRHITAALALYRASDRSTAINEARTLNSIGWYHALLGEHKQALAFCGEALDLLRLMDDRPGQINTLDSLGYAHHHLGDHRRATECYHQAIELCRETGDRYFEADTLIHLGDAHLDAGAPDAARNAWEQALAILGELDEPDAEAVRAKLAALG